MLTLASIETVNVVLTLLYWNIGKRIQTEVLEGGRAEYGKEILALIPMKDPLQREFYAEMCWVERWSVRMLREKIGSMLYERTASSKRSDGRMNSVPACVA